MPVLKKRQVREMGADELAKRLAELRLELAKDRAQIAIGGSPSNPGKVREVRRAIARILTKLNLLSRSHGRGFMKKIHGGR